MFLDTLLFLCCIIFLFSILMLIRNKLVYEFRITAIEYVGNFLKIQINTHNEYKPEVWDVLKEPSYNEMMFMLSCWTYKSFY